jgi:hypothetical protein
MKIDPVNAIIFIVVGLLIASVEVMFPRWLLDRMETARVYGKYPDFITKHYSGPHPVLKVRLIGFGAYALIGFVFYWTFVRFR